MSEQVMGKDYGEWKWLVCMGFCVVAPEQMTFCAQDRGGRCGVRKNRGGREVKEIKENERIIAHLRICGSVFSAEHRGERRNSENAYRERAEKPGHMWYSGLFTFIYSDAIFFHGYC
jgi:hypothetical protein